MAFEYICPCTPDRPIRSTCPNAPRVDRFNHVNFVNRVITFPYVGDVDENDIDMNNIDMNNVSRNLFGNDEETENLANQMARTSFFTRSRQPEQ